MCGIWHQKFPCGEETTACAFLSQFSARHLVLRAESVARKNRIRACDLVAVRNLDGRLHSCVLVLLCARCARRLDDKGVSRMRVEPWRRTVGCTKDTVGTAQCASVVYKSAKVLPSTIADFHLANVPRRKTVGKQQRLVWAVRNMNGSPDACGNSRSCRLLRTRVQVVAFSPADAMQRR